MSLVPFFPPDNADPFSEAVAHNSSVLRAHLLSAEAGLPWLRAPASRAYFSSYLRHRSRWYEQLIISTPASLSSLDELSLRALLAATSGRALAHLGLPASAWLDFAALFAPSNPGSARAVLGAAFETQQGLAFELRDVFSGVVSALAAAAGAPAARLPLATDALHASAQLLVHCPHAPYALQPASGLHNGAELVGEGTLLGAALSFYEHALPEVADAARAEGGGGATAASAATGGGNGSGGGTPSALLSRIAAASALTALGAVLEGCYLSVLRAGAGGERGGACSAKTGAARTDGARVAPALLSLLRALADFAPPPLRAGGEGGGKGGDGAPAGALAPDFFADVLRLECLRESLQPLLGPAVSAGWIPQADSGAVVALLVRCEGRRSRARAPAPAGGGGGEGGAPTAPARPADVAKVQEVLPHLSATQISQALAAAGGDVSAALTRLLMAEGEGGAPAPAPSSARAQPAVDPEVARLTLQFARAQGEREEEERVAEVAAKRGGVRLPPGRAPPPIKKPPPLAWATRWGSAAGEEEEEEGAGLGGGCYDDDVDEAEVLPIPWGGDALEWGGRRGGDGGEAEPAPFAQHRAPAAAPQRVVGGGGSGSGGGGGGGGGDSGGGGGSSRGAAQQSAQPLRLLQRAGEGGGGGGGAPPSLLPAAPQGAPQGAPPPPASFARKEAHKASRANHSRKRGADKKMARAMGGAPA
jgi:uncharacterized membrane protein YgcG